MNETKDIYAFSQNTIKSKNELVFSREEATLYERVSVRPLVGPSVALSLFGLLGATYVSGLVFKFLVRTQRENWSIDSWHIIKKNSREFK